MWEAVGSRVSGGGLLGGFFHGAVLRVKAQVLIPSVRCFQADVIHVVLVAMALDGWPFLSECQVQVTFQRSTRELSRSIRGARGYTATMVAW